MTLTEFILARIAEDEAVARAAGSDGFGREFGHWETYTTGAWATGVRRSGDHTIICESKSRPSGSKDHIARHDPARVLAQCAAIREVVAECDGWDRELDSAGALAEAVLRALAKPYADHPDYREEWT